MFNLINNNIPTYILGDFNCTYTHLGNRTNNTVGKSLISLINQGKLLHLGPHFKTFIRSGSASSPDKIFCNKHSYLNTIIEQGNITASDHLPIIFKLSTKPFYIKQTETYRMGRADWELFKKTLDNKITKNLQNSTKEQLEHETKKWLNIVRQAMDIAIPKTTYKPIYQIHTTPEIKQLERLYAILKNNAEKNGWNRNNYREYIRIRHKLKEKCKAEYNKNWEDKITNIINTSKDTKVF